MLFPSLVAKIRRVVDPNRSEGFKVIAEVFNTCITSVAAEVEHEHRPAEVVVEGWRESVDMSEGVESGCVDICGWSTQSR